jgi:hypothetical protein
MCDEPLVDVSDEHSVVLPCPVHDYESLCSIPLPRRSHLGIYEGPSYQPTGDWHETFVCLRHARAFVCSPRKIHLQLQVRDPGRPVSPLWQIEAVCAHDNCGRPHTIYTAGMPDWHSIASRILKTRPKMPCGDHDFVWREDSMRATEIAH